MSRSISSLILAVISFAFLDSSIPEAARASDIRACFNLCKLVKEESKDLKCEIAALGDTGAIMYLDVIKKPLSTREKIRFEKLLSCYFKTGGSVGEIHWLTDPDHFASCAPANTKSGYFCEKTDIKHSSRKANPKKAE